MKPASTTTEPPVHPPVERGMLPPPPGRGDSQFAPLTYHQERLWFIDAFERDHVYAGPPTYHNIPIWLWIDGSVETSALEAALNDVVARHDALRGTIEEGRQRVRAEVPLALAVRDLGPATDDEAVALAAQESGRPFLLEQDALLRASLYRRTTAASLLVLTTHHAVADEPSTRIIVEDLLHRYRARLGAEDAPLPAAGSFAAYATWLRGLPDAAFQQARAFWRWQLAGAVAPLTLPYIRGRHRIHVYAAARWRDAIGGDAAAAVREMAARERATLPDAVRSAIVSALHACSGQREIVIGTSHSNRDGGLEHLAGPLANLLVLRHHVERAKPFAELLRHVQRTMRRAVANRAMPFDRLVQELNPPKDMSRTALFDVFYQYLEPEPPSWTVPGATIARVESFAGYGKYDLHVTVRPAGRGLSIDILYNQELVRRTFVADLAALVESILRRAADDPGAPVRRHVRLPEALTSAQAALLRAEAGVRPAHPTIDAAFEAVAARVPDRVAVVHRGAHLTYRALARAARRVARALVGAGLQPGTPVATFLDRTPEAIAGLLGVLRAGATYVPVDPAYPPHRIAMLIEDSGAPIVLTRAALAGAVSRYLGDRAVGVIEIEACRALRAAPLAPRTAPGDVAHSIYTSGSTGRPKGCLVTHASVVQLVLSQAAEFALGEDDAWSWCHSLCFDFSVWEIFGTLLHGSRGVLLGGETIRDPGLLHAALCREEVTVLNQTPAAGYRLVEALLSCGAALPALRWLVFGGDALTPARLARWSARNPHVTLVNMYGITETTVHVTRKRLAPEEIQADSRSVGRALPNAATYVIGRELDLLPVGVLGEIGVTGDGVSLGYWNRPELTAERFVPDPFSGREGARLYRSGDEGRLLPNGEVEFSGRRDHQVKIRGHRIELGEIEKTLAGLPGVADAAVIATDDESGNRRLVAFVAPAGEPLAPAAVRAYLQERLIPAMVPGVIHTLSALPRTTTGKVDRRALRDVRLAAPAAASGYEPPRDDCERALVRIWEEVLGRTPVGIGDNFFEIGGDSILCMQICARAARAGIALTPTQLFEHATIEEISVHVGRVTKDAAVCRPGGARALLPAEAWFFAQDHPDPDHFNQSAWFDLAPGVTSADVEAALRQLQAHHEALRTSFVREAGGVHAYVVEAPSTLPFVALSLGGACREAREREALEAAEQAQRGLDIQRGPLFRWLFVAATEDQPARLLMVFHHLIVDGMSWRTLVDDLDLLLGGPTEAARLAALPAATSPRACLGEPGRGGGQAEDAVRGDVDSRAEAASASVPCDCPSPLDDNTFEHYVEIDAGLDAAETGAIAEALARGRLAWEEALVAAAGQALLDWTLGDDAELVVEGHGRGLSAGAPDLSRTVGWLMKLHRVRVRRSRGAALDWLREVRAELARAKRRPSAFTSPAHGLCVNYLGQAGTLAGGARHLALREADTGRAVSPRNRRAHLVDLHAILLDGRLRLRWGYCARLHRRETIAQLAGTCARFLRALPAGLAADRSATGAGHEARARTDRRDGGERPALRDYPLAPGQMGMLYHALLRPADAPEYVIRSIFTIEGPLDVDAFRASWALLLARHEALRASFAWDGPVGPVQRFPEHATLACPVHDWRDVDPATQQARLDALVRDTARRGLDPAAPPLVSVELVRTAGEVHAALLQIHHLVIDGWSLAILRDELLRAYAALHDGRPADLPPAGRFRDYLRHLEAQDRQAAERFWRARLQGVRACPWSDGGQRVAPGTVLESWSVDVLDRPINRRQGLAAWAARHHLTLNTIVQGVWCLAVSSLTRRADVVAGVVVAGRPPGLADVERTVGAFINTLPLRVRLDASQPLARWLARIQADFAEAQRFGGCALPDLSAWAGLPNGRPLFDTVLVCENYPASAPPPDSPVRIREERYAIKESVPVVLEYSCGARLIVRMRYRPDVVSAASVEDAGAIVGAAFEAVERDPDMTVGQLASRLEDAASWPSRRRQERFAAARRAALRGLRRGGEAAAEIGEPRSSTTEEIS